MKKIPKIKIGLRLIKTSAAVFICFLIDYFRNGAGMPFYSVIAAVLSMQKDMESSKKVSANRMIGTIIGGAYGLLILLVLKYLMPDAAELIKYAVISAAIIPLIYFTVVIKKSAASYITCVVFFSIVVSHADGDVNPVMFAFQRVTDTFIGILVSLCINSLPFLNPKDERDADNADADYEITDKK